MPATYDLTISAGTSGKVLQKDPNPATDGNPAWPNVADQYGNLQYMPGPEPDGSAGQYLGDIGIPSYVDGYLNDNGDGDLTNDENTPTINYVGLATGQWTTNCNITWQDSLEGHSQSQTLTAANDAINPFPVTYIGADVTDADPDPGDTGKTDKITLTCTDNSSDISENAELDMRIHQTLEVTKITGPYDIDPNRPDATTKINFPSAGNWIGNQPGAGENGNVTFDTDYALYGTLASIGTGLTDVGTVTAAAPGAEEIGAVLVAMGLPLDYLGNDDSETISLSINNLWPGTSSATGVGINEWLDGVPEGVSDTPFSGNYYYYCTPYKWQLYKNNVAAVDTWGNEGYESYGEEVLAVPITTTYGYIGQWTWSTSSTRGPQQ